MDRGVILSVVIGATAAWGCTLLTPYPGGGSPAGAISGSRPGGESPFDVGEERTPLVDPATDDSLSVSSNNDPAVAIPGSAFLIDLNFVAPEGNVVGGGIKFPGSDEIQWTFIEGLEGSTGMDPITFGYVTEVEICEDLPNLCHELVTEQFAVARNVAADGDVDGDGNSDGEFVVSPPVEVRVVLQCATCESQSCLDVLPAGTCQTCAQPEVCQEYYERCLAPGQPNADSDEAKLFENFLGTNGVLWSTRDGCAQGEVLCSRGQMMAEEFPDECGL